ncbi:hypothetical protein NLI96_g6016 [Meripilus lineatus]|uniref:Probable quinone oxidoreductase n=1 Tax=Meripilus lineatus TaxID=2056292 RepID=A0AAD5V1R1_9APHY|nr:hypothetical protein NLI96_g6016 [Physisporinus lineatus]
MSQVLPQSFRATIVPHPGDFDVIQMNEIPFPEQCAGELVIKVHYAGVNFMDNHVRSGGYPVSAYPYRFGVEGSGVVVGLPSDPDTLGDEDFIKRAFKIGSKVAFIGPGAFSEYVTISWKRAHVLPEGVSLRTGAAIHAQGLTALSFVEEAFPVKHGDIILVHTVAGGVGLLLAQLIKMKGGIVIGTTSTPEKAEIAKKNGADHVILYKSEDVVKRVLEITEGEGVHAIFDGVGLDTFELDFKVIRRKGTILFLGETSGPLPPIQSSKLVEKNIYVARPTVANYAFTPKDGYQYTKRLYNLVLERKLEVLIHAEYPFTVEGVRNSGKDLQNGNSIGKLLVKVEAD